MYLAKNERSVWEAKGWGEASLLLLSEGRGSPGTTGSSCVPSLDLYFRLILCIPESVLKEDAF